MSLTRASESVPATIYHFADNSKPATYWYVTKKRPRVQKLEPVWSSAQGGGGGGAGKKRAQKKQQEQPLTKGIVEVRASLHYSAHRQRFAKSQTTAAASSIESQYCREKTAPQNYWTPWRRCRRLISGGKRSRSCSARTEVHLPRKPRASRRSTRSGSPCGSARPSRRSARGTERPPISGVGVPGVGVRI